ncbi:TetR/AcrR family transcriptional regulator [Nocardioides halotolerans]|uniref:TetR/AcrR family transcriptional regulator n=1 Tax=Nocardioides halotolerans TaxID=433660 RepID=UPI0009FC1F32|nr:TetR/AcrR family transcriptional regulator [Nocardioides halotolerans]
MIPSSRTRRSPVDKYDERRNELAESALLTLGELGYARTSLREIASNSPYSHGVLHYYFADKLELVAYSITHYKQRCVTRYDEVVERSTTPEALVEAFAARLVETLLEETAMHRLWYDLRVESMFDARLRETVLHIDAALQDMIWQVVSRYAVLVDREVAMDAPAAYAVLDGLFEAALLAHVTGNADAVSRLVEQVHVLLPLTLGPLPRAAGTRAGTRGGRRAGRRTGAPVGRSVDPVR